MTDISLGFYCVSNLTKSLIFVCWVVVPDTFLQRGTSANLAKQKYLEIFSEQNLAIVKVINIYIHKTNSSDIKVKKFS